MNEQQSEVRAVLQRLQRLEKQHRNLRLAAISMAVLVVMTFAFFALLLLPTRPEMVVLYDEARRPRWAISAVGDSGGPPIFLMRDKLNRVRFELGEQGFTFYDEDGKSWAVLDSSTAGPGFSLLGKDGATFFATPARR